MDIKERLNNIGISHESELGDKLIKLDTIYQKLEDLENTIIKMVSARDQLKEDIELMELLLMHRINKDTREYLWASKR